MGLQRGDLNLNRPAPIHVAAICGSMRGPRSFTRKALVIALEAAEQAGASVDLIDLASCELPLCGSPAAHDNHPQIVDLRQRVSQAQGILLGSPEYHNSYSGVLKNALDLLTSEQLQGKIFGLLGVAGGSSGAINALSHLRVVVRGVGGWSLPVQISICNVKQAFNGAQMVDAAHAERVRLFGIELVRFARLHSLVPSLQHLLIDVIDEDV